MDGVDEIGSHVFQAGAVEGVEGHGVVHENFAKEKVSGPPAITQFFQKQKCSKPKQSAEAYSTM